MSHKLETLVACDLHFYAIKTNPAPCSVQSATGAQARPRWTLVRQRHWQICQAIWQRHQHFRQHCQITVPRLMTRLEINWFEFKHSFIPNHGDKHRITAASEESLHQINRGGGCELGVNIYAPSKYRRVKLPTHSWGYFGLNISKMTIICLRSDTDNHLGDSRFDFVNQVKSLHRSV